MQTIKISITDSEKQVLYPLPITKKKPIANFIREAIDTYLAAADVSFQESLKPMGYAQTSLHLTEKNGTLELKGFLKMTMLP